MGGLARGIGSIFGGGPASAPALPAPPPPPPVPTVTTAQPAAEEARKRYMNAGGRSSTQFAGELANQSQPQSAARILFGQG